MTAASDDGRDRLVVHRLGVVGRVAGLDHQRPEDLGADDGHADGEDQQPGARRDERRQRDPGGDPATDHVRCGPVADAADRRDVARPVGVVTELVAQPPDVDVDGPVEHLGLVLAVDRVEQLVAAQDAAVGLEERRRGGGIRPGSGGSARRRG